MVVLEVRGAADAARADCATGRIWRSSPGVSVLHPHKFAVSVIPSPGACVVIIPSRGVCISSGFRLLALPDEHPRLAMSPVCYTLGLFVG